MTVRRGLSRERLALIRRYTATGGKTSCVYCGKRIAGYRWGRGPGSLSRAVACRNHRFLVRLDPHFAQR